MFWTVIAAWLSASLEPASCYVSPVNCESQEGRLGGYSNSSMERFLGVFPLRQQCQRCLWQTWANKQ